MIRKNSPASYPVDLPTVYDHLRVNLGVDDQPIDHALINAYVDSATDYLDGYGGILCRCLITQSWELSLDGFPAFIKLPLPPVQSITSITYDHPSGSSIILPESEYLLIGAGSDHAFVSPARGTSWPSAAPGPDAVRVEFVTGYGDDPEDVPAQIRAAILEMVADRYAFRESAAIGASFSSMPSAAAGSLGRFVYYGALHS